MECGQLSENHLSLPRTYCKFIMWIGQQAPSLALLLHRFIKMVTTNHSLAAQTTFFLLHWVGKKTQCKKKKNALGCETIQTKLSISWCTVSTESAAQVSPASNRICSLKNFDLELQLINSGLI